MGRIRALAKESLIYGISSILSRFLNFFLIPFYTHVLTTSEFGINTYVLTLVAFLNIVYQFGFDTAYLRLGHDVDAAGRRKLFSTAFISQSVATIFFSALLLLFAEPISRLMIIPPGYRDLLYFASGILILDTLTVVPFAHLRLIHAARTFASLRMANVILNIAANYFFVVQWQQGLMGIFWANLVASLGTLLLILPTLFANLRIVFDRPAFRQLLNLGLPLVPAGLYGLINDMAGRIFLRLLSQSDIDRLYPGKGYDILQLAGIFGAAWKLGIFGLLLVQMYRMAWMPFFLQRQKDSDAANLFGRILLYLNVFIGLASVTLMAFLDKLVAIPIMGHTLFNQAYWVGLEIVPGVLLAYLFNAWFIHFTLGIYIAKQTRYLMWSNGVGALVTVATNFLLVPFFGIWGATVSAVLCYLVIAVMVFKKSQKLFPIEIAWSKMLPVIMWLAVGWTFGILVQKYPVHFSWELRLVLLIPYCLFPVFLGIIPIGKLLKFRKPF